jgi:flagellar hook-associated protein 3 FlgL
MVIRVTERSLSHNAMRGLQANQNRLSQTESQLTSGKQISRPSDSPTGTMTAMLLRSDMHTQDQYARNGQDGVNWLNTIDSALGAATDQTQRVRDLMIQGMSAGAGGSDSARSGIATEIDQIRQSVIGVANTRYIDRPVFGGTTNGGAAYDASGSYVGDGGIVSRTVAEGTKVRVDSAGEDVFGSGDTQLFKVLSDVSDHLLNDPSQLSNDLDRLDTALKGMQTAQASVGARSNRVQTLQQTANDRQIDLQGQLSEVEDIDLPKTITDMTLQQTAYQAALGATAKVIQPSLMDFLR